MSLKIRESQQQPVLFGVRAGLQDTFQLKGMCPIHGTRDMTGKQKCSLTGLETFGGGWEGRIEEEVGSQMETYDFINITHRS